MEQALLWAIVIIASIFTALAVMIVVSKAWRESVNLSRERRRKVLEPKVLSYAHGNQTSIVGVLDGEPSQRDRRVLEAVLLDHVQRVRGIEHDRLAKAFNELGFVDAHLVCLRSRRWWYRAQAAEKLGLSGARRAIDPLTEALKDEMPEVRLRAARALGLLGGKSSVRALVHALNESSHWSTIRVADILTGMGRQVVDDLIDGFPQLSLSGKLAALDILGRVRPLHAAPWLVKQLEQPETDVRARACHALGCIGDPHCAEPLIAALSDKKWPVRAMAAKALGRIRSTEAIPALGDALDDPQWWVRSNAAQALREVGPKGWRALEALLDHEDRFARHQVVLVLQEAGVVDRRVAELAGDGPSAEAARKFVERLAAAGQSERLRELSESHAEPRVRRALAEILPGPPPPPIEKPAAEAVEPVNREIPSTADGQTETS